MEQLKLCPRCGSRISFIWESKRPSKKGIQIYLYAEHRQGSSRWRCYLGPKGYIYAQGLHSELAMGRIPLKLRGAIDQSRILDYLRAILDQLGSNPELASQGIQIITQWLRSMGLKFDTKT